MEFRTAVAPFCDVSSTDELNFANLVGETMLETIAVGAGQPGNDFQRAGAILFPCTAFRFQRRGLASLKDRPLAMKPGQRSAGVRCEHDPVTARSGGKHFLDALQERIESLALGRGNRNPAPGPFQPCQDRAAFARAQEVDFVVHLENLRLGAFPHTNLLESFDHADPLRFPLVEDASIT